MAASKTEGRGHPVGGEYPSFGLQEHGEDAEYQGVPVRQPAQHQGVEERCVGMKELGHRNSLRPGQEFTRPPRRPARQVS